MSPSHARRLGLGSLLVACLLAMGVAGVALATPQAAKPAAANKYIGAGKCKNCHSAKASGDQYGHWKDEKHFKAFERLGAPEAKALGKTKGIEDPQKAEQCVKCHTTAAKEPDDRLAKGFERTAGVQCESCHGPGEKHMKARMAAAATAAGGEGFGDEEAPALQEIPKDEIIGRPTLATCTACHNEESPSFKPFCFKKRLADIAHFDRARSARRSSSTRSSAAVVKRASA
jgi:hypothetical protein